MKGNGRDSIRVIEGNGSRVPKLHYVCIETKPKGIYVGLFDNRLDLLNAGKKAKECMGCISNLKEQLIDYPADSPPVDLGPAYDCWGIVVGLDVAFYDTVISSLKDGVRKVGNPYGYFRFNEIDHTIVFLHEENKDDLKMHRSLIHSDFLGSSYFKGTKILRGCPGVLEYTFGDPLKVERNQRVVNRDGIGATLHALDIREYLLKNVNDFYQDKWADI
jgi:hypothetical protein